MGQSSGGLQAEEDDGSPPHRAGPDRAILIWFPGSLADLIDR
jgi:hypothetical protein